MELQGWVLMLHHSWSDYGQARGGLVGKFYTDIESVCRALRDDAYQIINIVPRSDGQSVMIECSKGEIFGAWLCVLETQERAVTEHRITWTE